MAADKPLQDIYNTVRIPLSDAIVTNDTQDQFNRGEVNPFGYGTDYGLYWNCYPQFFSDRSANQYSSQYDTWVTKRGPIYPLNGIADIPGGIGVVPTANVTNVTQNLCISQLDDVFVCAIWDSSLGAHRIVQYRPQAATYALIGTIVAGGGYVPAAGDLIYLSELNIAGVATLGVIMVSASETFSQGWFSTSVAGLFPVASLTQLTAGTDPNFPANLANTIVRGPFQQMDGWVFVMSKSGNVYNANLNTITGGWNALGVVQAIQYPDQGVGVFRYKHHLVAFGEDSIEFFNNSGVGGTPTNPKSPLIRTDSAFIKFGATGGKSIVSIDDTLYWWAKSAAAKFGLYKLDGYTPVKVSSLREDLLAARQQMAPELYTFMDRGKQHILSTIQCSPNLLYSGFSTLAVTNGGAAITGQPAGGISPTDPFALVQTDFNPGYVCWDIQTGVWWVHANGAMPGSFPLVAAAFANSVLSVYPGPTFQTVMFSNGPPHTGNGLLTLGNKIMSMWSGTESTGIYIYADMNIAGNAQKAITGAIQFNVWDFGNDKRKRIHKFKVIQRQYGLNTQSLLTPYTWVIINKTDGDYDAQSTAQQQVTRIFRRVCLQSVVVPRTYINKLGTARKWYFGVVQKSDSPWSVKAIELDITQYDN